VLTNTYIARITSKTRRMADRVFTYKLTFKPFNSADCPIAFKIFFFKYFRSHRFYMEGVQSQVVE
jgi:hypothetical protein